ncbi:ABC transporter permease [Rhodoplanes sp. TEM]|uniref:ABC transporter permease n=1 Tax=Rhodoplanes tepidamans TaxID=200616 RepID=A0ABT5J8P8_RHOTP|nr:MULTISPECIES: ABC transporter permease [Rhodoplanes]MDC7786031.1 ABC transporter permease [Rhodoplanes tepidamans]MDC7983828.1 ABC transporter permease [Rhodoplanes sp. TEM]MDQ0354873.1 NitT/TauT family transport system permease protein [Rhodoplanes tepidamans]
MSSDTSIAAAPAASAAPARTERAVVPHSRQYHAWLAARRREKLQIVAAQIGLVVAFLVVWEVAPRMHWVNPMLTSYPSAIWQAFVQMVRGGELGNHIVVTLVEVVVSFLLAMVLGTAVAILLWMSPRLERVLDPFLVVLNALPKIALVPIFYIWLGAEGSIYAVAVAVALFITILMLYTGFRQSDPNKIKLARTFGATRRQILAKVVLPSNVHTFIATLKANAGLSLVGVIVGEFQASKAGLGYLIVYGSQIFRMDMVMAAIVILGLMSLAIYALIQWAEFRITRPAKRGG